MKLSYFADEQYHKCDASNKTFDTKLLLRPHSINHRNTRSRKCYTCNKSYKTWNNLANHLIKVHGDKNIWKIVPKKRVQEPVQNENLKEKTRGKELKQQKLLKVHEETRTTSMYCKVVFFNLAGLL